MWRTSRAGDFAGGGERSFNIDRKTLPHVAVGERLIYEVFTPKNAVAKAHAATIPKTKVFATNMALLKECALRDSPDL